MKSIRVFSIGMASLAITSSGCFALDWEFSAASREICTNQLDDDGDGESDCSDTDCELYECKAQVPSGWTLVWVLQTAFDDPAQTECPNGQPAMKVFSNPAQTAICSECSCSYSGAKCSAPKFKCDYTDPNFCSGASVEYQSSTPDCYNLPNVPTSSNNYGSCTLNGPAIIVDPGTCTGTPSSVVGPSKFQEELRVCPSLGEQGGGCSLGDACLPKKPDAFNTGRTCIMGAGTNCPMGWDAAMFSAYEAGVDARVCSNCGCNTNTVTCSGGSVELRTKDDCSNQASYILANQQECVQAYLSNLQGSATFALGTPSAGTCTPAVPTGNVQTTGPHTICCQE
jgi:hypothetical protein